MKQANKIFDQWTILHVCIAWVLSWVLFSFPSEYVYFYNLHLFGLVVIVGFELFEGLIIEGGFLPNIFKEEEGSVNRVSDILITFLVFELGIYYLGLV